MNALQQVSGPLFLVAAYDRKYYTKEQAIKDWEAGKDFKIYNGPYCSIRDKQALEEMSSGIYIQCNAGTFKI
jgi:hypothetical protein